MGNPIVKSIGPNLAILSHKNLQKTTKMAISQNTILPKLPSPKTYLRYLNADFSILFTECGGI